jgi:inosine-uridine nucleoside N-ribohydrolase
MKREPIFAPEIHGECGFEGCDYVINETAYSGSDVFDKIYEIISQNAPVVFINTGCLTNLAVLIQKYPDIIKSIELLSIMGGAIHFGNWSPAAEFNIFIDPEAADLVFNSGLKIFMSPLEITHTCLIT